jgi:hypothetical protein
MSAGLAFAALPAWLAGWSSKFPVIPADDQCLGNCRSATGDLGGGGSSAAKVGAQYDIGIQYCDKGIKKRLRAPHGRRRRPPRVAGQVMIRGRYVDAPDTPPCPASELSGCRWRSIDHGSDLVEGQPEHIVEHERQSLGR